MKFKTLLFSLLSLIFMGFSSVAQTTYTFSDYPAGTQYAENETHVLDENVTLITNQCHFTTQLRVYSSASHDGNFYTNALPSNIQALSFNMGYKVDDIWIFGSNDGTTWDTVGTISTTSTSYADYTIDFGTNDYNRFKFDVVGTNQIRVASMTITYKQSSSMVQMPSFTPEGGLFETAQNVTISCETAGASIYYTTDGTTPDMSSTLYTAPINVSTTTTLKAIAYKTGMQESFVATQTYTFPVLVTDIASLRAGSTDGTIYKLTSEAILTFQTAHNNVKTIQDATGAILIYDPSGKITTTYNIYDGITGICGSLSLYGGLLEFVPISDPMAATSTNNTFVPQTMSIPEISLTDESKLITINDLSFSATGNFASSTNYTVTDANNNSLVIRTSYNTLDYIGTPIPETPKTITGIVTQYNGTIQFVPRSLADFVDGTSNTPILSATPSQLATFSYIKDFGPSDEQAISVTGINLTGNVSIACDSNFEFSVSDSSQYVNSLTLTPENGSISQTLLVRMKAGLDQNIYTGLLTLTPADTTVDAISYTLNGNVTVISSSYLWKKIENLNDLENNEQIIIAARNSSSTSDYAVMTAATVGKPNGVVCTPMSYQGTEILPMDILAYDTSYIWSLTKVNDSLFSFTNLSGEKLGYMSSTNFINDTNYIWKVEAGTSAASAMVPNHAGYKITNNTSTGRAIALNTSNKFAPYAVSNLESSNYNFFLDIFSKVETNADTTTLAMPIFTPAAGEYWDSVVVSISCTSVGATIHYTADGSTPDSNSPVYTTPLLINQTTTLKAIACQEGKTDSNVSTAVYTINITPVVPELTVSVNNMSGFAYDYNDGPSATQSFTITGENLSQDVVITVAGDFEIASSATGTFDSILNIATTSGSVNADVYVRMSAGLGIGNHTGTINIVSDETASVSLSGQVADPSAVYCIETFDNLGVSTSSSYLTGSFVGVNNVTWNYVQSRYDVEMTGPSLMLGRNRTPQAELTSGFISGGCGTISFDYMQAFSTNVNLNVYVNDILVGNVTSSSEANVIKNSGTISVYVGGPFTIKFMSANNSDGQVCIDNITWSNFNDGTVYTDAPTFTPIAGQYVDNVNVTINCATAGANIFYSTSSADGPWTAYTSAINLTQTTTIWAYAEKTGEVASSVASATYEIINATSVSSIAQLRQGQEDVYYTLTSEAILTFQSTVRNVKYIQDATGAILIDDNNHVITTAYNLYDGITGITGTLTTYNGMLQFIPAVNTAEATSQNNTVDPQLVTLSQLTEAYEAQLVKIENVTFDATGVFETSTTYNIMDATGEGVVRTQYNTLDYIGSEIPTTAVTITGVILEYNGVMQIVPRSQSDIEDYDAVDENTLSQISVTMSGNTMFVMNESDNTANMTVYNILGQPVMNKTISTGLSTFNHNLASGAYIVKVGDYATKLVVR